MAQLVIGEGHRNTLSVCAMDFILLLLDELEKDDDKLVGIVLTAIHDVGALFGECLLYESRRDRCILPRESLGNEFREGPRELAR